MLWFDSDWMMIWTAVGSLGQWFAGLMTFAAVVVALWLAHQQGKPKLRVKVEERHYVDPDRGHVLVTAQNFGNPVVHIQGGAVFLPDGRLVPLPGFSMRMLSRALGSGELYQEEIDVEELAKALDVSIPHNSEGSLSFRQARAIG
jgi:hypothetical protein